MQLSLRRLLAICFVLASLAAPLAHAERVVAVGDVHGEFQGFTSILRQAGVIDENLKWVGGRTTLVQTGDMVDRGADVRKVFDLLMRLEREASRQRGKVVVLLGNHELMNMTSALHDANPASYAAFADQRSEARRQSGWKDYVALYERLAKRYPDNPPPMKSENEWMADHPPGFIEYQEAISRNGTYGRWLRSKSVIAKVGDSIFLHGGVSPNVGATSLQVINERVRLEVEGFDRIREFLVAEKLILPFFRMTEIAEVINRESHFHGGGRTADMRRVVSAFHSLHNWSIYHHEGPVWFRGFGEWSDEEGEKLVDPLLKQFKARRFVVGHTIPQDAKQILPRFGGKVFLIDTAMLRTYGIGRPAALEINGDTVAAIYENERVVLSPSRSDAVVATSSRYAAYEADGLVADAHGPPYDWVDRGALPARSATAGGVLLVRNADADEVERVWLGPGNKQLPFRTDTQVLDFLKGAKSVRVDEGKLAGVTKPAKVLVENGRVRSYAVFRSQHREEENGVWESGQSTDFLKDSYKSEIAAYELSLLLGLDTVPPTIAWVLDGRAGSLQMWIENARPGFHEQERARPADEKAYRDNVDKMRVFDALIGNLDRHEGNMLVDGTGRVWWIDHSRSFMRQRDIYEPEMIQRCERKLWASLKSISPDLISERMAAYMGPLEIEAMLERREKLIELIESRIEEHGEDAVLYTIESRQSQPARRRAGA